MKKAEMGVGTLIIFIALLLVAAVAAGVLIQTASSLQEQSLATGDQARSQISTHAETIEVSASDGRNGNLTDFQQIIKLSPGSDPIKLEQVIFAFNTKDNTATLKYRGTSGICEQDNTNGYNTLMVEEIDDDVTNESAYTLSNDLDDDGADDTVAVGATVGGNTYLDFVLSTQGTINMSLGQNISQNGSFNVELSLSSQPLSNGTDILAYVTIQGNTSVNNTVPGSITFQITPYRLGEGYFTAVYEQQGTNWVSGNLQRGDIVRLCYLSPREITEDEEIRLNIIPKIGTSTLTQFVTPEVISTERVYLYP